MSIYQSLQEAVRNEAVAVGTTTVKISDSRNENNPRITILIRNTSSDPTMIITINLGLSVPTANNGIVLRQYESFTDTTGEGYTAYQGGITALSAVAGGQLSIMER